MESMFSAVLRIGLIITLWAVVSIFSPLLARVSWIMILIRVLSIILILFAGFIFFIVLVPR